MDNYKTIIVYDENNNIYSSTYLKRAKGLIKNKRAFWVDEGKSIRLLRPKNTEVKEMYETNFNKLINLTVVTNQAILKEKPQMVDYDDLIVYAGSYNAMIDELEQSNIIIFNGLEKITIEQSSEPLNTLCAIYNKNCLINPFLKMLKRNDSKNFEGVDINFIKEIFNAITFIYRKPFYGGMYFQGLKAVALAYNDIVSQAKPLLPDSLSFIDYEKYQDNPMKLSSVIYRNVNLATPLLTQVETPNNKEFKNNYNSFYEKAEKKARDKIFSSIFKESDLNEMLNNVKEACDTTISKTINIFDSTVEKEDEQNINKEELYEKIQKEINIGKEDIKKIEILLKNLK